MRLVLDFLKVNEVINIEVEPGTDFSNTFRTRVEDLKQDAIVIGMPIDQGNYVPVRPGSEIIIWYWDNSASYAYYCRVQKRIFEPIPLLSLEWPYKKQKVQRRNFVRVPANLPLEYRKVNEQGEEIFYEAFIRDLSGGGLQFQTKKRLIKGDVLQIKLGLPEDLIICKAAVTWVYTDIRDKQERYFVGIKFMEINEKLRERVIRYVFQRQRELIQKGVL